MTTTSVAARSSANSLLRGLLRRNWLWFSVDSAIGATFFLVGLLPGFIAKAFFDGLSGREVPAGLGLGGLLIGLVLVKLVHVGLGIAWMYIDTTLRAHLMTFLRGNLLARVLDLPAARALPVPVGDALSRFVEDVRASVETLCKRGGLTNLTSSLSYSVAAFATMWVIDPRVTLLAMLPTLVVVLVSYVAGQRVSRFRAASRKSAGEVGALLAEVFTSVQAIKLANAQNRIAKRVLTMNTERGAAAVRDNIFSYGLMSTSDAVLALGTGLILIVSLEPMRQGTFSVGDLALFIYLLAEIGIGVRVTGIAINSWRQAQVSLSRLHELQQGQELPALLESRDGAPPERALPPLRQLTVSGLSYRHSDGERGLDEVDLEISAGETVVIAGRTGSGKSTLVRCVLGMLPLSSGSVRWNEVRVHDLASFMRPPRVAYTSQAPSVFSDSLRANVQLGCPASDEELAAAVRAAVLEGDLAQLSNGWETPVGPRGHQLSGGQVQRLAAARMFLRRPDLLVLDDLSSALDIATEEAFWREIAVLAESGHACLAISNRRHALQRADRVVLLEAGRVVGVGPLAALLHTSALLRSIWAGSGSS